MTLYSEHEKDLKGWFKYKSAITYLYTLTVQMFGVGKIIDQSFHTNLLIYFIKI